MSQTIKLPDSPDPLHVSPSLAGSHRSARHGGGYGWTAVNGLVGITATELDADGLITRMASIYDGRQVPIERKTALLRATFAS